MSETSCPTCDQVVDCCVPSGLDDYLLVGPTFFNNQVAVLFQCPQGYVCTPGTYPKLIVIAARTIPWNPPPTPNFLPLTINCCDGPLTVQYDPNISQSDYNALLQSMVDEAARRLAGCQEKAFRGKKKKQTSDAQTVLCPNGDPITNVSGLPLSSFLPTSITISAGGNGLTMKAGTFTGATKDEANQKALDELTKQFNKAITSGKLVCGTVTAPCSIFENDNTSQGHRTMPNGPLPTGANFAPAWATLAPGNYQLQFVSGAYQVASGPNQFAVNGGAGSPVIELSVHHGSTCTTVGADNTIAANALFDATEAAAAADFLAQYTGNEKEFFVGDGSDDNVCMVEDSTNGLLGVSGTTKPIFDLVKIKKLTTAQPASLQIQNFATYANGRYRIIYGASTSGLLTFTSNAATIQAALNAMPSIISDGGVTVVVNPAIPNFGSGFDITWNNNGLRTALNPQLTTVNPGIFGQLFITQAGNAGLPAIQTLFVGKRCSFFDDDLVDPEWDGSVTNRYLSYPVWRQSATSSVNPNYPIDLPAAPLAIKVNEMAFIECFVYLAASGLPGSGSGCGWVMIMVGFIGAFATPSLLWSGVKFDGLTPAGTYHQVDSTQLDQPWTDGCPVDITHGVGQITLA
jgi:hypothetical protein